MIEIWIVPARRRRVPRRGKKMGPFRVRDLVRAKFEGVHPDVMDWLFIIAPCLAAHPEPALRDAHHHRFDDFAPDAGGGYHARS